MTAPLPSDVPRKKRGRKPGPPTVQATVRLLAADVAVLQVLADAQELPLSRRIAVIAHQRATEPRIPAVESGRTNHPNPNMCGMIVESR